MKAFLEEYFRVPEKGSVSEKTVCGRAIVTLITVLAILGAISFSAYAFFGLDISSPSITVEAAQFKAELSLSVTDETGTTQLKSSVISNKHTLQLLAGKTYTVTLKPAGSAQTGFCMLTASDCDTTYYTQQLGADAAVSGGKTRIMEFTLTPTADTCLVITASWGTSSFYGRVSAADDRYIYSGDAVIMAVAGKQLTAVEDATQPTQPEQTQTENTQPEPTQPEETQAETQQTQQTQAAPTEPTQAAAETE